jgi:hypothetical protein
MAWKSYRLSGYAPDLPADAVPEGFWSVLTNAQPRDGLVERSLGNNDTAITGTPLARMEWGCSISSGTAAYLVYVGDDVAGPRARIAWYLPGTGHFDWTGSTTWAASPIGGRNYVTGGVFGNGVLANDVTHDPVWLDVFLGALTMLTTTNFNALRPYKYMAVGIGDLTTAGARNTVRWSASATPGAAPSTWTPATTNDAGSFDVTVVGQGNLVDGGRLGEDFLIYGENSTHAMTYVGGVTVMANRSVAASSGIMARNCWADIGGAHVVLTRDDVVLVTAGGVKSIADGQTRRTIFDGLYNADGRHQHCQVWYDRRRGRVYIATPKGVNGSTLTLAYVWEVATGAWGQVALSADGTEQTHGATMYSAAAGLAAARFPELVTFERGTSLATSNAKYVDSNAVTASAQAETVMQKDDLDLGDASVMKFVRGLRLRATAGSTVTLKISLGVKNAATESYTYSAEQDYVLPTAQYAPFTVQGRWVSVKIRAPANTNVQYRVIGFDLDCEPAGAW